MNLFMGQILLNPGTICMDFMRVPPVGNQRIQLNNKQE